MLTSVDEEVEEGNYSTCDMKRKVRARRMKIEFLVDFSITYSLHTYEENIKNLIS